MTDRPSRYFVIASVAIFAAILLYGLLGGHGGLLTPAPVPTATAPESASPEPSSSAGPSGSAAASGSPAASASAAPSVGAVGRALGGAIRGSQRRPVSLAVLTRA